MLGTSGIPGDTTGVSIGWHPGREGGGVDKVFIDTFLDSVMWKPYD